MNTLLLIALLTPPPQEVTSLKLRWYGVVPAVVAKDTVSAFHLISEVHPKYQVNIITLDI